MKLFKCHFWRIRLQDGESEAQNVIKRSWFENWKMLNMEGGSCWL